MATALLVPRLASDFCRFTTIWEEEPKAWEAGRFSADMVLGGCFAKHLGGMEVETCWRVGIGAG